MTHISTLHLHQHRLGELDAAHADRVTTHLADCTVCADRLGVQRAERIAFLKQAPPAFLRPSPWARWRTWWGALVLIPVAAAVFLAVQPEVRTKGDHPLFEAWVQTGETPRLLYTGERVRAGTRIQLKFDPGRHRFVTLAGRDGNGAVEVYGVVPASGPGLATAPFALTLDASGGDQKFFAVLTDTRPDTAEVAQALAYEPVWVDDAEVASLVVRKE